MSRECCGPARADESTAHDQLIQLPPWWRDRALALPIAAGLLWISGLVLEWNGFDHSALVAYVLGLAAGAWTFVPGALRRLLQGQGRGRLGVGLLMTIAATGAVLLGHVGEAAALAFLFSIAETLEDRAMDRAQRGLRALLTLIPDTARVSRASGTESIPAGDVQRNDILIVGAGERIATDGVVVEGNSWVDTSAITGESVPVSVQPGDDTLAGSVNGAGTLRIKATAEGRDNSLTTIVHLVEQAHARKGKRARLADRIAQPLVPAVLLVSLLIAAFGLLIGEPGTWIERALVVLVAVSPCALAIAVPVTVTSAIGAASKFGVVIKSGESFEHLGTITTVALDKTGTLTRNEPHVVSVATVEGHTRDQVLATAGALEATSTHPFANAITSAAPHSVSAHGVAEHAGHGIRGNVNGDIVRVGSARWIDPGDLRTEADAMAAKGMSLVVVESNDQVIGVIGLRDELKPEAIDAIVGLHRQGITTVMVTGDNARTAEAIASQAGIDDVRAEQLPADKAAVIEELRQKTPTAMIGDGINDAPALASATVGIAMGATGSAAAVESADVAFTGTDLRLIPAALAHARRGRAIMTGNIALAVAIIVVLFPFALFGVLGLTAVVLIHEIAEVVVIGNGIRAARSKAAIHNRENPVEPKQGRDFTDQMHKATN